MPRLNLGKASPLLWEAVQGLGQGWGSLGRAGHGGRARAGMAGGGELAGAGVFARACGEVKSRLLRTRGTYRRPRAWLGAGTGRTQRAASAWPNARARDRTHGSVILPEFKRL